MDTKRENVHSSLPKDLKLNRTNAKTTMTERGLPNAKASGNKRKQVKKRPASGPSSGSSGINNTTDTHSGEHYGKPERVHSSDKKIGDLKNFVDLKTREERAKLLKGKSVYVCNIMV